MKHSFAARKPGFVKKRVKAMEQFVCVFDEESNWVQFLAHQ